MSAFISIHEIVVSWLLKQRKPIHFYVDALLMAAEGIQQLSFRDSLPMVSHTLLTKVSGQNHFLLPAGYADLVRVGIRYGDMWWPLPIADRLMPYSNSTGNGDLNADQFGPDLNTTGDSLSWYGSATNSADFSGDDFAPADFQTTSSGGGSTSSPLTGLNWYNGDYRGGYGPFNTYNARWYGVTIDLAQGLILVPDGFGYEELYLQYIGAGNIDNMTQIPVVCKKMVETYISWQYLEHQRGAGIGGRRERKDRFEAEERLVRAKYQQLGIEDINKIFGEVGIYGRLGYTAY